MNISLSKTEEIDMNVNKQITNELNCLILIKFTGIYR